jgi:hypothetical protein
VGVKNEAELSVFLHPQLRVNQQSKTVTEFVVGIFTLSVACSISRQSVSFIATGYFQRSGRIQSMSLSPYSLSRSKLKSTLPLHLFKLWSEANVTSSESRRIAYGAKGF